MKTNMPNPPIVRHDHVAAESLYALYHGVLQPGDTSRYDAYARVRDSMDHDRLVRGLLLEALKNAVAMNYGNAGLRGEHDNIGWVRVARAAIAVAASAS